MSELETVFEKIINLTDIVINSQFELISRAEQIEIQIKSFYETTSYFHEDLDLIETNLLQKLNQFYSFEAKFRQFSEKNSLLKEHSKKHKRAMEMQKNYNRYVKLQVKKRFGETYLEKHQVRELDFEIMQKIKNHANMFYLSKNVKPKEAWNNAMNSLRQFRHQQKVKKIIDKR